jgi:Flp pilus assembly protein TadD
MPDTVKHKVSSTRSPSADRTNMSGAQLETLRDKVARLGVRRVCFVVGIGALVASIIPALTSKTSSETFLLQGADAPSVEAAGLVQVGLKDLQDMNYGSAVSAYQAALQVAPHDVEASYDIGYIYQLENRVADAEMQYEATLELDPNYEPALFNLGVLHANSGDTSGAILYYQSAITANGRDANAHFNLGLLLRQSGQISDGNAEIRTAESLNPDLASSAAAPGNAR